MNKRDAVWWKEVILITSLGNVFLGPTFAVDSFKENTFLKIGQKREKRYITYYLKSNFNL